MILLNHIHDVIRRYPTLYKTDAYESAELLVLDQLFLTNGNGYEWYDGYLTDVIEEKAELYGVVEPDLLPANYFDHIEWKLETVDPLAARFFKEHGVSRNFIEKDGNYYRKAEQCARPPLSKNFSQFNPYPICQYAKMENIPDDVRPDWLIGAIKVVKAALVYYQDDDTIKTDSYYPSKGHIARYKRDFERYVKENNTKLLKERNITEADVKDPAAYAWRIWERHREKQLKYINDFLYTRG